MDTMNKTKHSPLPWSLEISTEGDEGMMITIPEIKRCLHDWQWADSADWERDLANAELIVTAVNERERLREALRQMRAMFFESHPAHPWIPGARAPEAIAIIDAALNEQKGE